MAGTDDQERKANGKKSETIEIRLSFEEKQAFADLCRTEGKTVSNVLRSAITHFLVQRHTGLPIPAIARGHKRKGFIMLVTGFVAGVLIGASWSTMNTDHNQEAARFAKAYMERLDKDGDSRISLTEYVTYTNTSEGPLPKASIGSYYIHEAQFQIMRFVEPIEDGGIIDTELDENCRAAMLTLAGLQHGREFDLLDDDGNGFLSVAEISQSKLLPDIRKLTLEFKDFDRDGDGFLGREEFMGSISHETEEDRIVTIDTYQTVQLPHACRATYGSGALMSLQPRDSGLLYRAQYQSDYLDELFLSRDRNEDGRISFSEFVDGVEASIR